ncbi:MAG TPA: LuxR C-terminal-related transcriptional regulator [Burkholderiaceae bacterium]|nr:LuxR C-terminal-related transcriptional regulator [Burkholderiaceae bacterium]
MKTLLSIKIAPPRQRRWLIVRERLIRKFHSVRECALICLQAPAGYGKTSLLAKLRREWLTAGACAAWLALDEHDTAERFVEALLLATYTALGRPAPALAAEQVVNSTRDPLAAAAALLDELANEALPIALVLDDVHTLPTGHGLDLLRHIAFNLPPNVHLIVGTRRALPFATTELLAHGQFASFDAADLAFRLEETRALLQARCSDRVDTETIVRLHERIEGWPMGLQLALVDVEKESDPALALRRIACSGARIDMLFADLILPRLDSDDVAFLTALAPLEELEPDLCAAVTGRHDAREALDRLRSEVPGLQAPENGDWLQMHSVLRDVLLRRFEALPPDERDALHWKAAQWLHRVGMLEPAARHALAAGRADTAYLWIGQALHGLALSGRVVAAHAWLERLPEAVVLANDELRIFAAWMSALSHEPREAFALTEPLLEPHVRKPLRDEALRVRGAAACYADDLLTAAAISAQLADADPAGSLVGAAGNAMLRATLALSRWETAGARAELRRIRVPQTAADQHYGHCYAEFLTGLSYLLDGRPLAAAQQLEPALARWERTLGRRSPGACLIAAALSAALLEQGRAAAAELVLANRLDVVERAGTPEAVALAYLTLARIAFDGRDLGRAQDLLEGLHACGVQRRQPRMIVTGLAEQVRIEACLKRSDACARAAARLREQRAAWRSAERGVSSLIDLICAIAEMHAALCMHEPHAANEQAARLLSGRHIGSARDRLEIMTVQCLARSRIGVPAEDLRREIEDTAEANGLARLLRELRQTMPAAPAAALGATKPDASTPPPARASVVQSALLTAKERDVLGLLVRNYSNKEIARALDVGLTTVKWHMRNVFGKLDVGSRRQAVHRAHMLQLVDAHAIPH